MGGHLIAPSGWSRALVHSSPPETPGSSFADHLSGNLPATSSPGLCCSDSSRVSVTSDPRLHLSTYKALALWETPLCLLLTLSPAGGVVYMTV